jgi:hypothetical protein
MGQFGPGRGLRPHPSDPSSYRQIPALAEKGG